MTTTTTPPPTPTSKTTTTTTTTPTTSKPPPNNNESHKTGVTRNPNFRKLSSGYLFPEIARLKTAYLAKNPQMTNRLISLGIGDTTLPIPPHILSGLVDGATKLGTADGYSGYGAGPGQMPLREKIASVIYNDLVEPSEVFVSDGAKCDIMRIQLLFGSTVISAVQDPSYPVYVDTSVMMGQTGELHPTTAQFDKLVYMPCTAANNFFPDYATLPRADVVYFCSPNNPTGATATREQLTSLVNTCRERGSILVFDAAYAPFVRDPTVPKSVYEIPGAKEVAIEVCSFSKYAGFTGVRLGWTVVPEELKFSDGSSVRDDFQRVMTTAFNGASNIVQSGGLACLEEEGQKEIGVLIDYYMENAILLKEAMESIGLRVFGGDNAPYVFVQLPEGKSSWEMFRENLEQAQVVTIPGAGFGPGGEGYLRLSAFASRETIVEACARLIKTMAPKER